MNGLWETVLKKILVLGIVSATLLAIVFVIVDLAPGFTMDAILGAIVGLIAGPVVSLMVFVAEQELAGKGEADAVGCTICNVIIGGFTGVIVVATAVTILVPALGLTPQSPNPLLWGALMGALIGAPLGAINGALIGASWRWIRFSASVNNTHLSSNH